MTTGKNIALTRWTLTGQLHFHFSLSCTGEGNGNPLQCSYLENPRDGASWWAAVYGVAQSRTRLKWLSSSTVKADYKWWLPRGWRSEVKSLSHVRLFATPWTVAYQALPSIGFSRPEYWNGLPFPSPGDLPNPGIKPVSCITDRHFTVWETSGVGGRNWLGGDLRKLFEVMEMFCILIRVWVTQMYAFVKN